MKLNKKTVTKNIFASLLICAFFSINSSFAIEETIELNDNNKQETVKVKKHKWFQRNKKQKTAKQENEEIAQYTNDTHSVFSLSDCINIAIKYNPSIRASFYDEEVYKSKIGQVWANYFPQIGAGVNLARNGQKYSHQKHPEIYRTNYTTMSYIPSVSADMMIFDFGKTKATADMAKRNYEAKKEDTKENINTIIYYIKYTYFNILFAQAQVKVYEDTVKDYELQLSQAMGFYKLGKKAKIDVVTAEYNLGKARLNLVKAKNVLEVANAELSKIMGIPEYTNFELSDEMTLNKFDTDVETLIKTAFDVRPELLSAQKSTDAAKLNVRATRREFAPDLGLFASYGNGIGNDYHLTSTQFGVGLEYQGLNLWRTKKQLDEAKALYKKTKADLETIKHDIYFNVKKNYIDLQTAKEEIVIAKLSLDQAFEQYRQVTGRYKAGVGDAIELKDGENTYLNARLDFYNSMLNYNLAAASLEKEIGSPLEFSNETILDISEKNNKENI